MEKSKESRTSRVQILLDIHARRVALIVVRQTSEKRARNVRETCEKRARNVRIGQRSTHRILEKHRSMTAYLIVEREAFRHRDARLLQLHDAPRAAQQNDFAVLLVQEHHAIHLLQAGLEEIFRNLKVVQAGDERSSVNQRVVRWISGRNHVKG